MDCRESRELMSGAVDNELAKDESSGFYEHIEICGSCKDEYDLERLTKAYIKRKITFVDVPYDLERAILAQLSAESAIELKQGFFARLMSNSMLQPIMAVGVVMLLAIILFFANKSNVVMPEFSEGPVETVQTSKQDALALAETYFQDVLSGKFKPQITAIATSDVAAYLNQNAGYSIPLPTVPSADWVGGSVSTENGSRITHVVYKMGEEYIYIYSLPKEAIDSRKISLPSDCMNAVNNNKWFWGMDSDGDTQVVWSSDGHVCIATANLGKQDLLTYLQTKPETVRP